MNINVFARLNKSLFLKLKESLISVIPITAIVFVLSFTPIFSLSLKERLTFIICSVFLIFGIALFNMGADVSMTPMGEYVGYALTKKGKLILLLSSALIMGTLITVAEPDLTVLASQVKTIINSSTLLIITVGVGVGLFLMLAVLKIVYRINLSLMLMFFYLTVFCFCALLIDSGKGDLFAMSFDSGGVTTGPITVPFIMAMGVGISKAIGGKKSNENSFGLIALCSIGPILAVLCLFLSSDGKLLYTPEDYSVSAGLGKNFLPVLVNTALEVLKALGLIVTFFVILQFTLLKLSRKKLAKIGFGLIYTIIGLIVFLTAVKIGFMPIGYKIGVQIAQNKVLLTVFGVVLGMVVVFAEPAVHVLNKQVEQITKGAVTKRSMKIALSVGVGLSIGLSIIRIIFGFSLLYYLIPGYLLSLGLSFFVPKIYTSIAFDSGGVASGPLTASFILPLAIGACITISGTQSVMSQAFGIVAMVAMTPLITIQVLGFKAVASSKIRENTAISQKIKNITFCSRFSFFITSGIRYTMQLMVLNTAMGIMPILKKNQTNHT